jgi:hypothetical protein
VAGQVDQLCLVHVAVVQRKLAGCKVPLHTWQCRMPRCRPELLSTQQQ